MKHRHQTAARLVFLALGAWLAVGPGCGASLSAIYEGDVRFEHCMALDARPAATPSERRMCWIEWVRYYTYGQTQDRLEYARSRASGTEGLAVGSAPEAGAPLAAPGPTSAFAPPPMVAGSNRPAPVGTGAATGAVEAAGAAPASPAPAEREPGCPGDCADARADCRAGCDGAVCEKSCSGKFTRCLERCTEAQPPRPSPD